MIPDDPAFVALLEGGADMKRFALVLAFSLGACGKGSAPPEQAPKASAPATSAIPTMASKPMAMERMIPVPTDKAQLKRMLTMGYTVHEDHMHSPGVNECAFDKTGGSVVH
jgi:hypothetical protein